MRANKPAGGSVDGARKQLADLRQFVIDRKIVSIPRQEQALVAESPPYNRGNFAYISIPGPYENAAVKATYYVAPPDPKWSAAERRAYLPGRAYLLFVSAHEVWPGHYLQSQFANANPSRVAALWWDYAFAEGWAHYTEEMMYDAGLGGGDPEMRVGMLANALLRDVRFISAICLHTGCMSLDESEKMFREKAFADAGNARQQALRGTYDPGYLAYTLGKLMIRQPPRRLAGGQSCCFAAAIPRPPAVVRIAACPDGAPGDVGRPRRNPVSRHRWRRRSAAVSDPGRPRHPFHDGTWRVAAGTHGQCTRSVRAHLGATTTVCTQCQSSPT